MKKRGKEYRLKHRERILKSKKKYYLKHREYILESQKKYRNTPTYKCYWCATILGPYKRKFCSPRCDDKYSKYKKRYLPMFVWKFYSNKALYFIIYSHYPKYKKLIFKTFPKKILQFLRMQGYKKLKYSIRNLLRYRIRITTRCRHLFIYKKNRNYIYQTKYGTMFCSAKCRLKYKTDVHERKKARSLISWGTEERPDKETRRQITNHKWLIYNKKRKEIDPAYRLITRMRRKTKQILKKNPKYHRITHGITIYETLCIKDAKELKQHFESLWQPGMSWNNYGTGKEGWVSDHIIPLKYFMKNYDLVNDIGARKKAFGKQNLQPLWWLQNAHKAAKLNYEVKEPDEVD